MKNIIIIALLAVVFGGSAYYQINAMKEDADGLPHIAGTAGGGAGGAGPAYTSRESALGISFVPLKSYPGGGNGGGSPEEFARNTSNRNEFTLAGWEQLSSGKWVEVYDKR